ncbi:MAG: hypothetical protein K9H26_10980 [Prolixibacteraceae bacterium]|nr:hypothetical protein [Prolixibacteraceae bacterium]
MKYSVLTYRNILMLMTLLSLSLFVACKPDDDGPDNTGNDEEAVWEPFQVKANTSYQYDYEKSENDELVSQGTINIIVGDPEVVITGTIDGNPLNFEESGSDDVTENFKDAIEATPAQLLYNPTWEEAFMDHELEVGYSWSYPFGGLYYDFEVKGTADYLGFEGYLVEMIYVDQSGKTDSWNSCINQNIPLALMTRVVYDLDNPEEYYMEITSYED